MNWRHKFEHWETQALCYIILSFQVQSEHLTASWMLWWYGLFCAAGAVFAVIMACRGSR